MARYTATIKHHSISSARVVDVGNTLHAAKIRATREFGDEFLEYTIVIRDHHLDYAYGYPIVVADRLVRDKGWTHHGVD